jgi:NUMOD4 motif
MTEWRVVDGFDGLYRISNEGIVQSCHRRGSRGARGNWWDLSASLDANGYGLVYLWDRTATRGKRRVRRLIHQLVAAAFVPNPEDKPAIRFWASAQMTSAFPTVPRPGRSPERQPVRKIVGCGEGGSTLEGGACPRS